MGETVKVTNRALFRMYTALRSLGGRRMATINADLKVARMLRVLAPLAEDLDPIKRRAAQDAFADVPGDAAGVVLTLANMRAAAAQEAIELATVEVALPLQFALREADLPKDQSGEEGWRNGAGIGALAVDLGPLFVLPE